MDRSEELLQLVLEYTNLSDESDKLHSRDTLSGDDNAELNCLDAIGQERPRLKMDCFSRTSRRWPRKCA